MVREMRIDELKEGDYISFWRDFENHHIFKILKKRFMTEREFHTELTLFGLKDQVEHYIKLSNNYTAYRIEGDDVENLTLDWLWENKDV